MKIKVYEYSQLEKIYPGMYFTVFGALPVERPPDWIYVVIDEEKDKCIGFTTVSLVKKGEVYIHWGGTMPEYRGTFNILRYFRELLSLIHSNGFKWILLDTENTNAAMIKLALSSGFIINGTKQTTLGKLYLQMIKEG